MTWFWLTDACDCVDRRLRLGDGRLLRRQAGLRRVDRDLRRVELALRQQLLRRQFLRARVFLLRVDQLHAGPLEVALRLGQVGARLRQVGAGLLQLRVEAATDRAAR